MTLTDVMVQGFHLQGNETERMLELESMRPASFHSRTLAFIVDFLNCRSVNDRIAEPIVIAERQRVHISENAA